MMIASARLPAGCRRNAGVTSANIGRVEGFGSPDIFKKDTTWLKASDFMPPDSMIAAFVHACRGDDPETLRIAAAGLAFGGGSFDNQGPVTSLGDGRSCGVAFCEM